jgi:hypothetical protein
MMDPACRYVCRHCGTHKFVPEDPLRPTPEIRTGCECANALLPHNPVGTIHARGAGQ